MEKLSKVAHFSPMKASYTTSSIAHVFLEDIVQLLGSLIESFWIEIESGRTLEEIFLEYSLEPDGLLQHFGRIYVLVSSDLHTLILLKTHHALYFAHPNVKNMNVDLRQLYF